VAVGDAAILLTSADNGASWTTRTSGTAAELSGVACASVCVAVGEEGVFVSPAWDWGAGWTPVSLP
jgi:photosystem II stability/assembly factor-like uncharacterized protein